jgi:hypothetical protein
MSDVETKALPEREIRRIEVGGRTIIVEVRRRPVADPKGGKA